MKKFIFTFLAVLALLAAQAGRAFAQTSSPITGTVKSVTVEIDSSGTTAVVVTYEYADAAGATQTASARLSVETAVSLGLVNVDSASGAVAVKDAAIGGSVTIDPASVLPEPQEEPQHPVGSALGDFFGDALGVDYNLIMDYHAEGVGFGVIAQALWLTYQVGGDSSAFAALLEAKRSGDYSGITLADGSTPRNWGDVVKSLKKGSSVGAIKSGRSSLDNPSGKDDKSNNGKGNNGKGGGKP